MTATAKGGKGIEVALVSWRRRLGHLPFKMVAELAQGGVNGIVITDLLVKIPGPGVCAVCVVGNLYAYLTRKDVGRASFWNGSKPTYPGPCLLHRLEGGTMCTSLRMTTLALYTTRGLSAIYVRNRMPRKALDGRTP